MGQILIQNVDKFAKNHGPNDSLKTNDAEVFATRV